MSWVKTMEPKVTVDLTIYHAIKSGKIVVTRYSKFVYRFWAAVDINGPIHPIHGQCWKWLNKGRSRGYAVIKWGDKQLQAHRCSWILNSDTPIGDLYVLHRCDNKECTNPYHLFLGTHQNNMDDMVRKGRDRKLRGEESLISKLTDDKVRHIRKLYISGNANYGLRGLADKFKVSTATIYRVVNHQLWKHVK